MMDPITGEVQPNEGCIPGIGSKLSSKAGKCDV